MVRRRESRDLHLIIVWMIIEYILIIYKGYAFSELKPSAAWQLAMLINIFERYPKAPESDLFVTPKPFSHGVRYFKSQTLQNIVQTDFYFLICSY
jgi:hypothetical protein